MNDLVVIDPYDLAQRIMGYMSIIHPDGGVNVVCNYETAVELLLAFCDYDQVSVAEVNISAPWVYGYNKEYLVAIDSHFRIWVEKMYQEYPGPQKYVNLECDCLTFVHQDCSHKSVANIDDSLLIPFCFEDELND